jgi:hypothetical protein
VVNDWQNLEDEDVPVPLIRLPLWALRLLVVLFFLGILLLVFIALDLSPLAGAIPLVAIVLGCGLLLAGRYFRKRQRLD